MPELRYVNLTEDVAEGCAELELVAFPNADPDELLTAEDIRVYARTFSEGFFVCLDGDRVVGQGAGIFLDFDWEHPQHTIAGITGEHQCGNHNPDGEWYYGTDMVVHPDYRRRGIGSKLYELRQNLVKRYNRRGIIAGGHMPGFADHKAHMSAEEYLAAVSARELYDPTLTFQMDNGFQIRGALPDYLKDDHTDSYSALIVWENAEYQPNNAPFPGGH